MQVFGVASTEGLSDDRLKDLTPTTPRLAEGIRAAVDLGAKVVNVSMSVETPDPALADAVSYATAKGALVVASAGDRGSAPNAKDGPRYPAAFPGVVSVTSVNQARAVDTSANVQGDHITVAAVGQGLNAALGHVGDCLLSGCAGDELRDATGRRDGGAARRAVPRRGAGAVEVPDRGLGPTTARRRQGRRARVGDRVARTTR